MRSKSDPDRTWSELQLTTLVDAMFDSILIIKRFNILFLSHILYLNRILESNSIFYYRYFWYTNKENKKFPRNSTVYFII